MNILIIGDSWGVPNYSKDWDCLPEKHTEFLLKKLGYNVYNFSVNAGSILDSIEYAFAALDNTINTLPHRITQKFYAFSKNKDPAPIPVTRYNGEKIDWVLWFHTEAIRDHLVDHMTKYVRLEELHNFSSHLAYRGFVDLLNRLGNPKTAVIGGQAPIDPILYQYHTPDFEIKDWRSQIVGKSLPRCISLARLEQVNMMYDSIEEKTKTLDIHAKIMKSMQDYNLFFDHCHPGPKPHAELTKVLDKVFKGEVAQTV